MLYTINKIIFYNIFHTFILYIYICSNDDYGTYYRIIYYIHIHSNKNIVKYWSIK